MHLRRLVAILFLFGLAAGCSSDDEGPNAPAVSFDVGVGGDAGSVPLEELCGSIPAATNPGGACTDAVDCGDGGVCVARGGEEPRCAQICLPSACGNTCASGQSCARLSEGGGQYSVDINGDGEDDPIGACLEPVPGDQGAYDPCGEVGSCQAGMSCAGVEGRAVGTCFEGCSGDCADFDGFSATCAPTSDGDDVCVIPCDPGAGDGACPSGLECVSLAQGAAVCVR